MLLTLVYVGLVVFWWWSFRGFPRSRVWSVYCRPPIQLQWRLSHLPDRIRAVIAAELSGLIFPRGQIQLHVNFGTVTVRGSNSHGLPPKGHKAQTGVPPHHPNLCTRRSILALDRVVNDNQFVLKLGRFLPPGFDGARGGLDGHMMGLNSLGARVSADESHVISRTKSIVSGQPFAFVNTFFGAACRGLTGVV